MTRCRLVALDVDGTLMSYDGVISDEVRAAVARRAGRRSARGAGDRPRRALGRARWRRSSGLTEGWVVCSNGAVTARLDPAAENGYEIVRVVTFDPGPALRTIAMELPDALYAVEDLGAGLPGVRRLPRRRAVRATSRSCPWEELTATPATRVVIRAPTARPEEFHELVERVGLHEVEYAVGWSAWLDLTPGGVSKASALEEVRQHLGVRAARDRRDRRRRQRRADAALGGPRRRDGSRVRGGPRGGRRGHGHASSDDGALAVLHSLLV